MLEVIMVRGNRDQPWRTCWFKTGGQWHLRVRTPIRETGVTGACHINVRWSILRGGYEEPEVPRLPAHKSICHGCREAYAQWLLERM